MTMMPSAQPEDAAPRVRTAPWLPVAVIVAACLLVYGRTATFPFVAYDDNLHVTDNPYLDPPTWASVGHFWTHAYEYLYVPLSYSLFALLALVSRIHSGSPLSATGVTLDPHVFHTANIALHTINALVVYALLRHLRLGPVPALVGSLVFALHPLQVESVVWVSELRGLLSATFALGCLLAYVRGGEKLSPAAYIVATLLFAAALLAKPSAVTVPISAFALGVAFCGRPWRMCLAHIAPWLAGCCALLVATSGLQSVPAASIPPIWQRPLIAGDALAFYAAKMFVPFGLAIDYGRTPSFVLANGFVYATAAAGLALLVIAYAARRRASWAFIGIALAVIGLLPVLGLVPFGFQIHSTVADRYAYLALLGPAYVSAALTSHVRGRVIAVPALLLACLAALAFARVGDWRSTPALMRSELVMYPASLVATEALGPIADMNRGNELLDKGQASEALAAYDRAAAAEPNLPKLHYNRGNAYIQIGQFDRAVVDFVAETALRPSYAPAYVNAGIAMINLRRPKDGAAQIEKAIAIGPPKASWYTNLGVAYAMQGRIADAQTAVGKALALAPGDSGAVALQNEIAAYKASK